MSVETQKQKMDAAVPAVIRRYEPRDRAAVRAITCATAFRNAGAQSIFKHEKDLELFADYWSLYYTDFEPESAWVAEREGRVVGYLFGCLNSDRCVRIMAWRIVPRIVLWMLWRLVSGQYPPGPSRAFVRWMLLKSWREAPVVPTKAFPAHFHCNLLPGGYNRHLYTRLATLFMEHLSALGITHMQGQIQDAKSKGVWHRVLTSYSKVKPGWILFSSEKATDFGRDVLGQPTDFTNRAYGVTVENYRGFLKWAAKEYRL